MLFQQLFALHVITHKTSSAGLIIFKFLFTIKLLEKMNLKIKLTQAGI